MQVGNGTAMRVGDCAAARGRDQVRGQAAEATSRGTARA